MATRSSSVTAFLRALTRLFFDVAFFWHTVRSLVLFVVMFRTDFLQRLWAWWTRPSQKDIQLECLNTARYYEEWKAAAFALDELYGNDLWFGPPLVIVGNSSLQLTVQATESFFETL
jgi:TAG lipase/lysophosphatidylethanolamine acyltransferase